MAKQFYFILDLVVWLEQTNKLYAIWYIGCRNAAGRNPIINLF